MWEYIDSVEAPALHRCAKHCGQVKPLLQFEILSARFPNHRVRPASLNPEQKGCRELFPIHSVTALRNAFCRTEPDDNCLAILSTAVSRRQPARMSGASLAGGVDA
jgi:hypothetical protein